jgi:hypothetical protein
MSRVGVGKGPRLTDNFAPGVHATRDHAYLAEIFDRLESSDECERARLLAKAHALVGLWRRAPETPPFLIETWERLLAAPVAEMRRCALADDEEGRELRHSMPFAGILTHLERAALFKAYPKSRA